MNTSARSVSAGIGRAPETARRLRVQEVDGNCDDDPNRPEDRKFTISYAGETSTEIALTGQLDPLWVDVHSVEIEQVLINLLQNAIESRPDSKRVTILVSASHDTARIEVHDNGCGITERDQTQIFDPFFTTRMRDSGNGLGLSVAYGIVRDHGGSIEVESREGKGTCVSIDLPLATH